MFGDLSLCFKLLVADGLPLLWLEGLRSERVTVVLECSLFLPGVRFLAPVLCSGGVIGDFCLSALPCGKPPPGDRRKLYFATTLLAASGLS